MGKPVLGRMSGREGISERAILAILVVGSLALATSIAILAILIQP